MIPVIDLHCDTIPELYTYKKRGITKHLYENEGCVDIKKLQQGHYMAQCFSLFTELTNIAESGEQPFEHANHLLSCFKDALQENKSLIRQAFSVNDLLKNKEAGLISAILTAEEGAIYEGKLENLYYFYDQGIRISTFTWNYENELGYPNPVRPAHGRWMPDLTNGLKEKGYIFLEEMERLGIIPDLSHLNDAGIFDVLAHAKGPVIASHSNSRVQCEHLRNLTDDMIRKIALSGGVIGMNFYPCFIKKQSHQNGMNQASVSELIQHIRHVQKIGGIDCLALGTDFDGFTGQFEISHAGMIQTICDVLEKEKFSVDEIEKMFFKNALRVFTACWK